MELKAPGPAPSYFYWFTENSQEEVQGEEGLLSAQFRRTKKAVPNSDETGLWGRQGQSLELHCLRLACPKFLSTHMGRDNIREARIGSRDPQVSAGNPPTGPLSSPKGFSSTISAFQDSILSYRPYLVLDHFFLDTISELNFWLTLLNPCHGLIL